MKLMYNNIGGCEFRCASWSPLLAGMNWNNGTNCGSQRQNANNYRWNANSNISTRFLVNPGAVEFLTPMEELVKPTPWLELNSLLISNGEQNTQQEEEAG